MCFSTYEGGVIRYNNIIDAVGLSLPEVFSREGR
jgi:hypothetical protein